MMSEVTVVVDVTEENSFTNIGDAAKTAGLNIDAADADNCAIEGTIESNRLADLRAVPGVKYVRISMEYVADYPTGDPRDLDKEEA